MTCAPCKTAFLAVARLLEKLPPQEEPLKGEIRAVKEMVVMAGYHIGENELSAGRTKYKES